MRFEVEMEVDGISLKRETIPDSSIRFTVVQWSVKLTGHWIVITSFYANRPIQYLYFSPETQEYPNIRKFIEMYERLNG